MIVLFGWNLVAQSVERWRLSREVRSMLWGHIAVALVFHLVYTTNAYVSNLSQQNGYNRMNRLCTNYILYYT